MKLTRRRVAVAVGLVTALVGAAWYYDACVCKPLDVTLWKERCAGWRVVHTHFAGEPNEFVHSGKSILIRKGEPLDYSFGYGGQFFGLGHPIAADGKQLPHSLAERDTLCVMLLQRTHEEHFDSFIAVVVMER